MFTVVHAMKRYPRLIAALRKAANLSAVEAADTLMAIRMRSDVGCEAVARLGGPQRVLRDAIRRRHLWRP
jgi:hypothetical protein